MSRHGRKAISGDLLTENTVMLAMHRLGFEVKSDPTEHDIYNVRLNL
jgi:acetyltransferase